MGACLETGAHDSLCASVLTDTVENIRGTKPAGNGPLLISQLSQSCGKGTLDHHTVKLNHQ